jgi:hypothetical protein
MKFRLYGSCLAACLLALAPAAANAESQVIKGIHFCIDLKDAPARDVIVKVLPPNLNNLLKRVGTCPNEGEVDNPDRSYPAVMSYYEDDGRPLGVNPNKPGVTITRAVIVIHGAGGAAEGVLGATLKDMPSDLRSSSWIVAPQFVSGTAHAPKIANLLRWPQEPLVDDGEKTYGRGDNSISRDGEILKRVSSYDVLDALIRHMIDTAEKDGEKTIKDVVIMGHSRGSKTVNRYSLVTKIDGPPYKGVVNFRFLSASAGSYIYLGPDRYKTSSPPSVENLPEPREAGDEPPQHCSNPPEGYDVFPFGLDVDPLPTGHYAKAALRNDDLKLAAVTRFNERRRIYTVAHFDNYKNPDNCGESMQASSRTGALYNYKHHLEENEALANTGFCVYHDTRTILKKDYKKSVHDAVILRSPAARRFLRNGELCSLDDNINTCEREATAGIAMPAGCTK